MTTPEIVNKVWNYAHVLRDEKYGVREIRGAGTPTDYAAF